MELIATGGHFFEAPRWYAGRWYVSDLYRNAVVSFDVDGRDRQEVIRLASPPSGIGWRPDGTLLVVSMFTRELLSVSGAGEVAIAADLSTFEDYACNDMVVDGAGRAWIGTFGFDFFGGGRFAPGSLLRVDPDGTTAVAAEDLRLPNGSVISPDGATLIVGETLGSRYTAFTVSERGELSDRRTWAQMPIRSLYPDGCCLDAQGRVWTADAGAGRCLRLVEGGATDGEVFVPEGLKSFACMLGGPERKTLMICCAPDSHRELRAVTEESVLIAHEVDVPGAGYP